MLRAVWPLGEVCGLRPRNRAGQPTWLGGRIVEVLQGWHSGIETKQARSRYKALTDYCRGETRVSMQTGASRSGGAYGYI